VLEQQAKDIADDISNLERQVAKTISKMPESSSKILSNGQTIERWLQECDRKFLNVEQKINLVELKY